MRLENERESTNFVDETGKPWYSPDKLLTAVQIAMSRVYDPKGRQAELDNIQRQRDANPLPKFNQAENSATKVSRSKSGKGWDIQRPGAVWGEFQPSYADSGSNMPSDNALSPHTVEVLTRAGLMKPKAKKK